MTTYAQKPRPIDFQESFFWAIESLKSVGVGPAGVGLFDLVNRQTYRAHRVTFTSLGLSKGLVPISGSLTSSGYTNFNTTLPVSFKNFDGAIMTVTEVSLLLYSWDHLVVLDTTIELASAGLSFPGGGTMMGTLEVLYADGRPVDFPDLILKPPTFPPEPPHQPITQVAQEEALVRRMPSDVLFAFDKYLLKKGDYTQNALLLLGGDLGGYPVLGYGILIVGHTDSVGSAEYNLRLSKRRAETVAKWLIEHGGLSYDAKWVKTIGKGASEPIASNSTSEGRAENRRVEGYAIRKDLWEKL